MIRRHAVQRLARTSQSFVHPDLGDFELGPAEAADPAVLQRSDIAPWGLDLASGSVIVLDYTDRDALIGAPFVYQEQAAQAASVFLVPYADFCAAFGGIPRPVWLHSVGRCGSTFLARRLATIPGVCCLSEPGIYCAIQTAVEEGALDEPLATELIRASTASLASVAGRATLVVKTRSADCRIWPLFDAAHPDARALFLYRQAALVVQSFDRILGYPHGRTQALPDREALFDRQLPAYESHLRTQFFAKRSAHFTTTRRECGPWAGLLLSEWIDKVSACLAAQQRAPERVFALRYEDLVAREEAVMEEVAAFLGRTWPGGVAPAGDSQAGTALEAVETLLHPLDAETLSGIDRAGRALLGSRWPH